MSQGFSVNEILGKNIQQSAHCIVTYNLLGAVIQNRSSVGCKGSCSMRALPTPQMWGAWRVPVFVWLSFLLRKAQPVSLEAGDTGPADAPQVRARGRGALV